MNTPIPTPLFDAIRRDLKPVRPLASPERRALGLLPLASVLLVGLPVFWSSRNHSVLAPWPAMLLSSLETVLSLVILFAAFREAVPGRELAGRALASLIGSAAVAFIVVNATTLSPVGIAPDSWLRWLEKN